MYDYSDLYSLKPPLPPNHTLLSGCAPKPLLYLRKLSFQAVHFRDKTGAMLLQLSDLLLVAKFEDLLACL
jgi:hypothetical protein